MAPWNGPNKPVSELTNQLLVSYVPSRCDLMQCVWCRVMCAPVVQVTDVLSMQEVEGSDDIWISPRRLYAVPVSVSVPDITLTWQFTTRPKVNQTDVHCLQTALFVVVFTVQCYANTVYAVVMCLSVCVSVTLWDCIKTVKCRITQIIPHDSQGL